VSRPRLEQVTSKIKVMSNVPRETLYSDIRSTKAFFYTAIFPELSVLLVNVLAVLDYSKVLCSRFSSAEVQGLCVLSTEANAVAHVSAT
jgi:hypothetical protein